MATPDINSSVRKPEGTPTAEEKLANLEERFAVLEKTYKDLHEKIFTGTDNSKCKTTEVALAQIPPSANETKDLNAAAERVTVLKSRAKIVINKIDPKTGDRIDQLQDDKSPTTSTDTGAFTLTKIVYENEDDNTGELEIINPNLLKLLRDVLADYPFQSFRSLPSIHLSPYQFLIFNWDNLELATKQEPKDETDKQTRDDLKLLLDTISNGSGCPIVDRYFKTRVFNSLQNIVTFETLWTLFPPCTLVYGKPFQGQDQVFFVKDVPDIPTKYYRENYTTWTLRCYIYDWDGKKFRRLSLDLKFDNFTNTKPIIALPFYPLKSHSNSTGIQEQLINRGKIFKRICLATNGSRMFEYKGSAMLDKKGFSGFHTDDTKDDDETSPSTFDPELEFLMRYRFGQSSASKSAPPKSSDIESRVMVDYESYFRYGSSSMRVGSLLSDGSNEESYGDCENDALLKRKCRSYFDDDENQKGSWKDEQYILCPPRVLGYILRDKQWAQLQVEMLSDIPNSDEKNSWSTRLQLSDGEETKKMILGLVNGHGTTKATEEDNHLEVDDIVARKGKGLVILLYGPPGVGKTSTAETVAIAARKPLFSISVADVGTKAKNVESNLAKIFALATSWQAILLIDEADVFLESRGKGLYSSTERNALVSVFLRVLEYYQGILMLTTNQIARFDIAVQSRIHIAIKYSRLNQKQTMAIFKGFLDPLDEKGLIKNSGELKDWLEDDVCQIGLDGRQIRNIVTSALSLARADKRSALEKKDIKKVLTNVKDFKDEFIRQFEKYMHDQDGTGGYA